MKDVSFLQLAGIVVLSGVLHVVVFASLGMVQLPPPHKTYRKIKFRVLKKKRPTPKKKKAERPKPRPRKKPKPRPRPRKRIKKRRVPPPPNQQAKQASPSKEPPTPIFGVTQSSLSHSGKSKVAVRLGNTLMKDPDKKIVPKDQIKPYVGPKIPKNKPTDRPDVFSPIPEYEVDSNPIEKSKAVAIFPAKAKKDGIAATVVLSLQIRKNGRVRRAKVVSIRPASAKNYGFGRAAAKALRRFVFIPAKYKGKPVDVVIRYVYKFELED